MTCCKCARQLTHTGDPNLQGGGILEASCGRQDGLPLAGGGPRGALPARALPCHAQSASRRGAAARIRPESWLQQKGRAITPLQSAQRRSEKGAQTSAPLTLTSSQAGGPVLDR